MYSDFGCFDPTNVFQQFIHYNESGANFYRSRYISGTYPQQVSSASLAFSQVQRKPLYSQQLHEPSFSDYIQVFGFIATSTERTIKNFMKNTSWSDLYKVKLFPFCYPEHVYFSKPLTPLTDGLDLFELKTLIQAQVKSDIPEYSTIIRPYAKNLLEPFESADIKLAYNVNRTVNILKKNILKVWK